ncbi:hypothetical protein K438DRAFT_1865772 [Mycena galopus ATCC 62051]|nr:hypothetical protein K438DRAFT_1865772 [Mycena galopus ATCC 62051]
MSLVSSPSTSFELKAHLVDTWLSRSRCCPLSIHFDKDDIDEPHASELLAAVAPHRTRWEYLDLSLSPSQIAIIQGPMPLLRYLDLTVLQRKPYAVVAFSPAPLLRSIILRATSPLNFVFPLGQMTSLTLEMIWRSEYVVILRQTYNLVHCELGIWIDHGDASDLQEHGIELPCLESLAMKNDDAPNVADYLDDFLVPALRSLRLEESFLGREPIDRLSSFIANSGCDLKEIYVADRKLVSKASYRDAFPSIQFPSDDDSDATSISTNSTDQ